MNVVDKHPPASGRDGRERGERGERGKRDRDRCDVDYDYNGNDERG